MTRAQRSCLDIVEEQFRALSTSSQPLLIDGESVHGALPQRPIPLDELRVLVLKRQASGQVKDAVWSYLVRSTRTPANPWRVAVAGMMIPGLKRIAAKLGPCFPGEPSDLDSEILAAFLQAVENVDPGQSGLPGRLYRVALRRGYEVCEQEQRQTYQCLDFDAECPSAGNPDLALARAVLDGVVTARQANLVCGVLLDRTRRSEVARRLGMSRDRVRRELNTATRGLSAYLAAA
jgi:DNA-directed RNA polymerase specialized sigma24 family protein